MNSQRGERQNASCSSEREGTRGWQGPVELQTESSSAGGLKQDFTKRDAPLNLTVQHEREAVETCKHLGQLLKDPFPENLWFYLH